MKVKSIAEYSLGAFCNTFDLHLAIIGLLFEWPLKTGFTVICIFLHTNLSKIVVTQLNCLSILQASGKERAVDFSYSSTKTYCCGYPKELSQ